MARRLMLNLCIIRPEMKFEDVEGLKKQIAVDSDFARNMFLIG